MTVLLAVTPCATLARHIARASGETCRVERAATPAEALTKMRARRYEILFLALDDLPADDFNTHFLATFRSLHDVQPSTAVIVVARPQDRQRAVSAVKLGASDYLTYPIEADEVHLVLDHLREAVRQRHELDHLRSQLVDTEVLHTDNPAMQTVLHKVQSVAPTRTTVLLQGETGTGKGVLARRIHQLSRCHAAQFIHVHCGAIPETLLESELFGHEKGAFTGAHRRKLGKFDIARGGTIFLDEVGTMTPVTQIKLLQVLQEGRFSRVGGEETIDTDARVIAATNADIAAMTAAGQFRKDLYYRINVFPIELPPLRERIEDVPSFVQFFLRKLNRKHGKAIGAVHPRVLAAFGDYAWPGNLRELENLMERAYILESTATLMPESFPGELFDAPAETSPAPYLNLAEGRRRVVKAFEQQYLRDVLERNAGRIDATARDAAITPRRLHTLMARYGYRKEDFRRKDRPS